MENRGGRVATGAVVISRSENLSHIETAPNGGDVLAGLSGGALEAGVIT